ncbi:MAG TPA: hypothetical protein VJC11_00500 [Patescibacteria group bacterium]|nr:hypothetical protein [Patescibacteria group bacterium]
MSDNGSQYSAADATRRIQGVLQTFRANVRRFRAEYHKTIDQILRRIDDRKLQEARKKLMNNIKK